MTNYGTLRQILASLLTFRGILHQHGGYRSVVLGMGNVEDAYTLSDHAARDAFADIYQKDGKIQLIKAHRCVFSSSLYDAKHAIEGMYDAICSGDVAAAPPHRLEIRSVGRMPNGQFSVSVGVEGSANALTLYTANPPSITDTVTVTFG